MATKTVDVDLDFGGVGKVVRALMNPVSSDPVSPATGEVWYNTTDSRLKVRTAGGTVSLATTSDTGSGVASSTWDAQSVVVAVADDTPVAVALAASQLLARRAAGDIGAVNFSDLLTDLEALGIDASTVSGSDPFARANHTGTQLSSTISDFSTAVDARVQLIVDSAPAALDTLNELAAALGDDPNFSTTVTNAIAAKTDKYAANIGNGADQSFVVNHGLGSTDVIVQVRVNSTGDVVECEVEITDANNVTIKTNSTPASNAYRVVVVG